MIRAGKNKRTLRQTRPSATLSTTNPTGIGLVLNLDLSSKKPVTNCHSHSHIFILCKNILRVLLYFNLFI